MVSVAKLAEIESQIDALENAAKGILANCKRAKRHIGQKITIDRMIIAGITDWPESAVFWGKHLAENAKLYNAALNPPSGWTSVDTSTD